MRPIAGPALVMVLTLYRWTGDDQGRTSRSCRRPALAYRRDGQVACHTRDMGSDDAAADVIPAGDVRDVAAAERDRVAEGNDQRSQDRDARSEVRDVRAAAREDEGPGVPSAAAAWDRTEAKLDRQRSARDREHSGRDREHASRDRDAASADRRGDGPAEPDRSPED